MWYSVQREEAKLDRPCQNANIVETSQYCLVYNTNKIQYFVNRMRQTPERSEM